MSFLRKLFGGKKKEKKLSIEDTIQKLQSVEKMLIKKQQVLEKKIEQEKDNAKKYIITNKRGALQALTLKKRYEKQLAQTNGTMLTIKRQQEALVRDISDMNNDVVESQAFFNEISQVITNPLTIEVDVDGDALQNELDELIKEEMDKQHLSTDIPVADLPKSNVVSYQHQYLVVKAEVYADQICSDYGDELSIMEH